MSSAHSPGKIILTGEHAILAGCPALAMASTPLVHCTADPHSDDSVSVHLPLRETIRLSGGETGSLTNEVKTLHAKGHSLHQPEDLLFAAVDRVSPEWRGILQFSTQLPIGSGMGASAAFLLSLLKALCPEMNKDELYTTALELEHLQHGVSSGLDIWTSLHGGLWWVQDQQRKQLELTTLPGFQLFHTGSAEAATGECVKQVKQQFPSTDPIWREFTAVITRTRSALLEHNSEAWSEAIRDNHTLLSRIGVVPDQVQDQITELENAGGAAKICGAGSIRGDTAGIVLVRDTPPERIPKTWTELSATFSVTGTSP